MSKKTLSENDISIIRALQGEGRRPVNDIAEDLNISSETVRNRMKNLEKRGIIKGTTLILDPKKMDQDRIIFIGIKTTQHQSNSIVNKVKEIPGMLVVTRSIGRYGIEAIAIQKNIDEISVTKDRIGDFQGVRDVDIDILVDNMLLCPRNFEFD